MVKGYAVVVAAMALALAAGALRAHDLVELQSGEVFYGRVLRHNKSEVSIQLASGGILSFRISQVRRVRQKRHERPKFDLETFLRGAFPNQDEAPADPTVPGTQLGDPFVIPETPNPDGGAIPRGDSPDAGDGSVVDEAHHFRVDPPSGFVRIPGGPGVLEHYRDPLTQANFIITAYQTDEPLLELKKKITRSYTGRFRSFLIEQDMFQPGADYDGWLVEVRSQLGDIGVRQLQFFVRTDDQIIILTYSVPENYWRGIERHFKASLASFEVLGNDPGPTADGTGDTPGENSVDEGPSDGVDGAHLDP